MVNAYKELGLVRLGKYGCNEMSYKYVDNIIKEYANLYKEYGVNYEQLKNIIKNKSFDEQKDIMYDSYIYLRYKASCDNKPEKMDKLLEAYESIKNKKCREVFAKEFYTDQKNAIEPNENINIQNFSRTVCYPDAITINDINDIRKKNKRKYDPNNQFKEYIGDNHKWGVKFNIGKSPILINDLNDLGEHIIVNKIGTFNYETLLNKPSEENKTGKSCFKGKIDIIGVTKFDLDGNQRLNEILFTSLRDEYFSIDKSFFINVLLSDYNINFSNDNCNGFIGNIACKNDAKFPEYYIEGNSVGDKNMVNILEISKFIPGYCQYFEEQRIVKNFEFVKRQMLQVQTNISKLITYNPNEKGDKICLR